MKYIFLNKEIKQIKKHKEVFIFIMSLAFCFSEECLFVDFFSFNFLHRFICSHTEQDAYYLIHLLFITLLNVLKSIRLFCSYTLFFNDVLFFFNAFIVYK